MAAGLGFKDFVTGEVLTAADVDGYLMQGIWVFASAAARDSAVTSPQEGNFAYLKDTNTTTYYTGSAWTNLDTTGMVNPMTTTGDMIYSSSGSTPARLGLGTANQQLRVNSGATAPEWFTPTGSSSGMTLITNTSFSASSAVNINNCFSSTYNNYKIMATMTTSANSGVNFRFRNSGSDITTATYYAGQTYFATGTQLLAVLNNYTTLPFANNSGIGSDNFLSLELKDVFSSTCKFGNWVGMNNTGSFNELSIGPFKNTTTSSFDGFSIYPGAGNITGSVQVYGLAN